MEYKPHNYQKYAYDKILELPRAGLFLDMGLGKTVITLSAIYELMYNRFEISKVLVIAPLRVAETTWTDECNTWDHLRHLRISKVLGNANERRKALNTKADIYIINRENVSWLVNEYSVGIGNAWKFDMVVIDELSSFKSHKSLRFKSLRKQIFKSSRVVGLTGTPSPNGLLDLWSQIYLLDGGERLGKTITGYRSRYFIPGKRNKNVIYEYNPRAGTEQAIMQNISDICLSMSAEDYLELPERIDVVRNVELSDKELKLYRDFERKSFLELGDKEVNAVNAAALTNKLLQFANGAMYTEGGGYVEVSDKKLTALDEIIDVSQGKPIICFYSYRHDLERILAKHPDARTLKSDKDIADWNNGKISLLLVHPQSAGHGLNLQHGGSIIVWFGLTWKLENYLQANARLHRQGQKEKVIIHHLVAKDTADEDVMVALKEKTDMQEAVMRAIKARVKAA